MPLYSLAGRVLFDAAARRAVRGLDRAPDAAPAAVPAPPAPDRAVAPLRHVGVNLTGGDFGAAVPGVLGADYIYPADVVVDHWLDEGCTMFRLPVVWERIQRAPLGPLQAADMAEIDRVVRRCTAAGAVVVLDLHNYGKYNGVTIPAAPATQAAFNDLWSRLAARYANDPRVWFGLMNEPVQPEPDLTPVLNGAIAAIRAAGAAQTVVVPGPAGSGAGWWHYTLVARSSWPGAVADPAGDVVFEVHHYLNAALDGLAVCDDDAVYRAGMLAPVTGWARARGARLLLGETGLDHTPAGLRAAEALFAFLQNNSSVWVGALGWAGCGFETGHYLKLDPYANDQKTFQAERPQAAVMARYLPGGAARGVRQPVPLWPAAAAVGARFGASAATGGHPAMTGGHATHAHDLWRVDQASVECRFSLPAAPASRAHLYAGLGHDVSVDAAGRLCFGYVRQSDLRAVAVQTALAVADGVERHLACSVGPAGLALWVDDRLVASSDVPVRSPYSDFHVRHDGGAGVFAGTLRELALWDTAKWTASAGPGPRAAPLTGYEEGLMGLFRLASSVEGVVAGEGP